jgi:hypothetical protein
MSRFGECAATFLVCYVTLKFVYEILSKNIYHSGIDVVNIKKVLRRTLWSPTNKFPETVC